MQGGEAPGTPQGTAGTPRGGSLKRTASLAKPSGPDAALVGSRHVWKTLPGKIGTEC